jgi:hypothetical protein
MVQEFSVEKNLVTSPEAICWQAQLRLIRRCSCCRKLNDGGAPVGNCGGMFWQLRVSEGAALNLNARVWLAGWITAPTDRLLFLHLNPASKAVAVAEVEGGTSWRFQDQQQLLNTLRSNHGHAVTHKMRHRHRRLQW